MQILKKFTNPWFTSENVMSLSAPLIGMCVVFSCLALLGYLCGIELLYRPLGYDEATHPLTAISIFLIALAMWFGRKSPTSFSPYIMALVAALIVGFRLIDFYFSLTLSEIFTPFKAQVAADIQSGKSNAMGVNTAVMLFIMAAAVVFKQANKLVVSQLLAFISLAIPVTSLTGYAYNISAFYGQMSEPTSIFGCALGISILAATANAGGLKAILSTHSGGTIARVQALACYLIPLLLGFLVIKSFNTTAQQAYLVFMWWQFVGLLSS
ncbi:hypothetical protein [uncultured Paraglaciecola sp.]|uniref:hypothetical protein n=1 Tax=uncultured Paraglaciecola sp. TaxID=1765024 RepID=UPI002630EB2D|nr:hypothetical protein [uncultured Paraglaciecola sp.]